MLRVGLPSTRCLSNCTTTWRYHERRSCRLNDRLSCPHREKRLRLSRRTSLKAIAAAVATPTGIAAASRGAVAAARSRIRLVVLDMGGTIIEDHGEGPDAMKAALATGGVTASLAAIGEWRGGGKKQMVRHFVELRT